MTLAERSLAAHGHFGRDNIDPPRERLNKVQALRAHAVIAEAKPAR